MKTVATARHVAGLRAAAFLSAGIARVPFWKFALADAAAAVVTIPITFGLAYFFSTRSTRSWPTCTGWSAGWRWSAWWRWPRGLVVYLARGIAAPETRSRVGAASRRRHCP